ncbi:MAG: hypothetical protein AAF616_10290 [Bacteroidota bacterium]
MQNFTFRNRNLTSGPHLLGLLLFLAGLLALASPLFLESASSTAKIFAVGGGAIFIGILIITSHSGTFLDFTEQRFKEYFSVFGYHFGEWNQLPQIKKVRLFSHSYISRNIPNGVSPTLSAKVTDYKLLLFTNEETAFLTFSYSKKGKAEKAAETLAARLGAALEIEI